MVELNLLPDVKKEYLKSQRTKQLFTLGAFVASLSAIAIVILTVLYVFGIQQIQISSKQGTIDKSIETLQETEDLDKILTVQKQLKSLPTLNQGTIAGKRVFNYLRVLTPNDVSLLSFVIDYDQNVIEIKGQGTDFKAVNTFVDTLKNASYKYSESTGNPLAFSAVVLDRIGRDDEGSSFKINLIFDPLIFNPNIEGMTLVVPNITSTRSQVETPKSLFNAPEETTEQEGQ